MLLPTLRRVGSMLSFDREMAASSSPNSIFFSYQKFYIKRRKKEMAKCRSRDYIELIQDCSCRRTSCPLFLGRS